MCSPIYAMLNCADLSDILALPTDRIINIHEIVTSRWRIAILGISTVINSRLRTVNLSS